MTTSAETRGPVSTMSEVADALRGTRRSIVATHENPDGDAIGSARAAELVLRALGHDVLVHVPGNVVPREYSSISPSSMIDSLPDDIESRVVVCIDCGNASRIANPELLEQAARVINIDHHADNTHYGDLNVVVGSAACSTLLVRELARELDIDITPEMAKAIYIGLVTDTGRFQYSNTNPEAFALAAELVHCGADIHQVFREVYESLDYQRVKLLGLGLGNAQQHDGGRVVSTHLTRNDFDSAGADDDDAEGIVDFLRATVGTHVAVFVRDLKPGAPFARKGSLRTTRDDVDVSVIARTWSGGGHRQAAGFSTDDTMEDIVARVVSGLEDQQGN